jgi:hypothetical protein
MKKVYATNAFFRYQTGINTTYDLLEAASFGVSETVKQKDTLLKKFSDIKAVRGKIPKSYQPLFEITKIENSENVDIEMDERTASFLKKAVENSRKNDEKLTYYFNSIILVYIWGLFETYLTMALEEAFRSRPEMLKSNESISYKDVIENHNDIVEYLILKQVDRLGHNTVTDNLQFLNKKISFSLNQTTTNQLKEIYLIRNIIAHNTGIIRKEFLSLIPKKVRIKDQSLIISKEYITKSINLTSKVVDLIEKQFIKKVFGKTKVMHLFIPQHLR